MTIADSKKSDIYSIANKTNGSRVHTELLRLDVGKFNQRLENARNLAKNSLQIETEKNDVRIRRRSRSIGCLLEKIDQSENNDIFNNRQNLLKSKKKVIKTTKKGEEEGEQKAVIKKKNIETNEQEVLYLSSLQLSNDLLELPIQTYENASFSETSSLSSSIEFELNAIESMRLKNRRNGVVINTFEKPKKHRKTHFQLRKFSLQNIGTKQTKRVRCSVPTKENIKSLSENDHFVKMLPGIFYSGIGSFQTTYNEKSKKKNDDLKCQSDSETKHFMQIKKTTSPRKGSFYNNDNLPNEPKNESKKCLQVNSAILKKGLSRSLPSNLNNEKLWLDDTWHALPNKKGSFHKCSIVSCGDKEGILEKSSYDDFKFIELEKFKIVIAQNPLSNETNDFVKKNISNSSASIDLAFFQNQKGKKCQVRKYFFSFFKTNMESKLVSYLSNKIYEPEEVGNWCRELSESIKNQIIHVTGDAYKVTCQIFISAVYDKGAHIATQSSHNSFTDYLFTATYRGEELFALATAAVVINS
ncbi:uncharacterized protein LOC100200284 [Hydra vulgaris]|uniref:Uncharacterized protein LOC100200284 n=1 Tax=Hydra vulgaris TaxID=6087 RepID=A0ABM4C2X0_HYDVU